MNAPYTLTAEQVFSRYLILERQARAAATSEALAYCMVNDSQSLFGYRHVALLIHGKVQAVTGVSVPDPHAPFVAFIERACQQLIGNDHLEQATTINAAWLDQQTQQDWQSLSAAEALWIPLKNRKAQIIGGLWYARDHQWQESERILAEQLAEVYAHALVSAGTAQSLETGVA